MNTIAKDESKNIHVGVVVVHGMGMSRSGRNVVKWADALQQARKEQLKRKTDPEEPEIVSIRLDESPAHLTIKDQEYVKFVDCWWADLFDPPSYWTFVRWCITAVPIVFVAHVDEYFRRLGHVSTSPLKRLRLSVDFVFLFLGLVLFPIILMLLLLLPVLGLLPITRDFANSITSVLRGYVGDAQIFLDDKVYGKAIVDTTRSVIEELIKELKDQGRCIVLAHSQGAAVAHRAIKELDEDMKKNLTFISFGSGLRKLSELEDTKEQGSALLWGYLSGVVSFFSFFFLVIYGHKDTDTAIVGTLSLFGYSIGLCGLVLLVRILWEQILSTPGSLTRSRRFNWGAWVVIGILSWIIHGKYPSYAFDSDALFQNPFASWLHAIVFLIPILFGLAFTMLMEFRYGMGRKTDEVDHIEYEQARWEGYRLGIENWFDFYASHDPVPNGPLLDYPIQSLNKSDDKKYVAVPLVNSLSVIKDHNDYWRNKHFLKEVAGLVFAGTSDIKPSNPDLLMTTGREFCGRVYSVSLIIALLLLAPFIIDGFGWLNESIQSFLDISKHEKANFFVSCDSAVVDDVKIDVCGDGVLLSSIRFVAGLVPYVVFTSFVWMGSGGLRRKLFKKS